MPSQFQIDHVAVAKPERPRQRQSEDQDDLDRVTDTIRQSSRTASWPYLACSIEGERTSEPIALGTDA